MFVDMMMEEEDADLIQVVAVKPETLPSEISNQT